MAKSDANDKAKFGTVLLIDEDDIDNFINERMLYSTGFAKNIIVRNSAASALAYLRELSSEGRPLPDVIFLDLNMPVMDGFGFLKEFDKLVKEGIVPRGSARIIVLSSSISPLDIDRASTNPHVLKYLNKPLSGKYLEAIEL